jgi:thiopeptide-type bacteriocin biosynthesis protein
MPHVARSRTRKGPALASSPAVTPGLYEPLDFVMVRAPLLPVENYLRLGSSRDSAEADGRSAEPVEGFITCDTAVRRALAVGSSSLLSELDRRAPSGRKAGRARGKYLRYLIRMSTRPTPFGLFAGVALGQWGEETDLALSAAAGHTRMRPDMEWLLRFVMALEARPGVRQHLRLVANSAAIFRAGRVFLTERAPSGEAHSGTGVSIRATRAVQRALALARRPIPYPELAAGLLEAVPGSTPAKIDGLLTELWQHTLLLTDLRPPLTTDNPARYVAERLAGVPAARESLAQLEAILDAAAAWDALPGEAAAETYPRLVAQANAAASAPSGTPFMVDMALGLQGQRMHHAVGAEAARAAELLLRLTPLPAGMPFLSGYRQAFEGRYGHDREVPVLELLDPHFGLGPPSGYNGASGIAHAKYAQRSQTLLDLAVTAMRERRRVVELDPDTLARLEMWPPTPGTAPPSLDINVFVAARSAAALDAEDFQVIVGPNLGASAAGRNLGRFADLLAPDAVAALGRTARGEEGQTPHQVWAELVYLPRRFRTANVAIRPPVRSYEIALGVSPGVADSHVIPLDELVVGVRQGRFYVHWPSCGVDVIVCAGHMLNHMNAPAVVRFLAEVSRDGMAQLSAFDWGPASGYPFLPRVQVGRIVLRPAEWRIDALTRVRDLPTKAPATFHAALDQWRARWQVPRHVALSVGDNRLILDLEDDHQCEELRAEVSGLAEGGALTLQEVLPDFDRVWLTGPGGHFVTEFVVSLALRADRTGEATRATAGEQATAAPAVSRSDRLRPPGSDWLFVKLYGPRLLEEDLVAGPIYDFAEEARASGLADEWFFIRYSDPDPHIRLRFRGAPERLARQLLPRVCAWGADLMADEDCLRFGFDTYDRELERYGGEGGTSAAESVFAADSRAVAELLRLIQGHALTMDRTMLAVLTVDDLLAALGLDEAERLAWYRAGVTSRHEAGEEYRHRKVPLRRLIGDPAGLPAQPGGAEVARILAARRRELAPAALRLAELGRRGELSQAPATLYRSYVHLHFNRLVGSDGTAESRVLGLLLRTREGLARAPQAATFVQADRDRAASDVPVAV